MKEGRYKIAGRFWRVRFGELPDSILADTDHETREMRFSCKLFDRSVAEQLDTMIHEIMHAQQPRAAEECVEEEAAAMAHILLQQFSIE